MTTENPQDALWAALGRDVTRRRSDPPQIAYQDVPPPRADVDRILMACASGFLPVLTLSLLGALELCWSWRNGVPSILFTRMLLAVVWGAFISWAVYPVLWSGRTLKPIRMIGVAVALIWVMPLVELPLSLFKASSSDYGLTGMEADLLMATHQWVLFLILPLWVAIILAFRHLQRRFPWYDPIPPRRMRSVTAFAVLLLPLLTNIVAAAWIQLSVPKEITDWEARYARANGRLNPIPSVNSPWFKLSRKSYELEALSGLDWVHDTEREALDTLELHPPLRDEDNAVWVFERLLRHTGSLQDPTACQLALVECQLRTFAWLDPNSFDRTMEAFLDSENVQREKLETMASRMRQLANLCPSTTDEIDARLYRKRFRHRDFLLTVNTVSAPLLGVGSPMVLYDAVTTRREVEAWLRSRPSLPSELSNQPMSNLYGGVTSELTLKPRLKLYEVICQLRAFRQLRGQYPDHLEALQGLSKEDLARFEFVGHGEHARLIDRYPYQPSFRNERPRSEWELR